MYKPLPDNLTIKKSNIDGLGVFTTENVEVEYPIGHRRRREQGIPLLIEKFKSNLSTQFSETRSKEIISLCEDQSVLENTSVIDFMALLTAE